MKANTLSEEKEQNLESPQFFIHNVQETIPSKPTCEEQRKWNIFSKKKKKLKIQEWFCYEPSVEFSNEKVLLRDSYTYLLLR